VAVKTLPFSAMVVGIAVLTAAIVHFFYWRRLDPQVEVGDIEVGIPRIGVKVQTIGVNVRQGVVI
jgi:hypothetical protein